MLFPAAFESGAAPPELLLGERGRGLLDLLQVLAPVVLGELDQAAVHERRPQLWWAR